MSGIILSLLIAIFKALGELAGKIFTQQDNVNTLDEYSLAFSVRCLTVLIMSAICFIQGFQLLDTSYVSIIILSAVGNAITTVTALKAVKHGDLSLVGPLGSLTIPFLLISSFFILHELPNTYGFIGIFMIFLGTYILGIHNISQGYFAPIRSIFQNTGAKYMILTALIWSITAPIDKLGVQAMGTFHWLLYTNIGVSLIIGFYTIFIKKISLAPLSQLRYIKKSILYTLVLGVAMVLQMFALKLTLAIYVISIKRASGIFSVIFGAFFFQEKNIIQKLIAASIMLVGVGIITFFGNI